jgi:hypothetical protein
MDIQSVFTTFCELNSSDFSFVRCSISGMKHRLAVPGKKGCCVDGGSGGAWDLSVDVFGASSVEKKPGLGSG